MICLVLFSREKIIHEEVIHRTTLLIQEIHNLCSKLEGKKRRKIEKPTKKIYKTTKRFVYQLTLVKYLHRIPFSMFYPPKNTLQHTIINIHIFICVEIKKGQN